MLLLRFSSRNNFRNLPLTDKILNTLYNGTHKVAGINLQ